jgi:hypothetical protein
MANMSYCRFHNTLSDLYDCQNALEDYIDNDENVITSDDERHCAKRLIELCREIADHFEESDIDRQKEMFNQEDDNEEDSENE